MKNFLLIVSILISLRCIGQDTFKHPSLLSVSFVENDFKNIAPFNLHSGLNAGLSTGFLKGINQRFDWQINYSASFPDSFSKKNLANKKNFLSELDFALRSRMFPKEVAIQPYFLTGAGFGFVENKISSYLLVGPGVQWHFKDVYIQFNAQYKPTLAGNLNNHYSYSIGVAGRINKTKSKNKNTKPIETSAVKIVQVVKDTDGDGIVDSLDHCPTVAGLLKFNGCPDTDKDGIPDVSDKCPTIFGKEKYQGCPPPDTDGDGINDEEDSCINVPGIIQNHGCPEVAENSIKSLNLAAKKIYFETGKAILLPQSFTALDTVVKILQQYPSQHLLIEGHTDNVGSTKSNLILSENRAKAVFLYLVQKGIAAERLSYKGFGATKPVADNSIPEGRARNRRVELKLYNWKH